ncbi:MAG: twin-arginine translocase TatA/TatE family subunit [Candidatus Tokpelaia sp.]|uniref:twin-arginine translocase TatA/TatE family subunit n=1 Tax=Candidatus Tokpelaia sp. TaxID=2233777 RepID=UPI001239615F|nr:twin-arginine translocase TatA/TatE family subunit [Candidatus Tokpelaia sp.]KAA6205844.1 MAG: twin-arginine translocase TatA/TatE family subunit [Candidatus Tokpelaia sp.]KAA6207694.1 MAG: twin-arginine translocase TatA/TatE family subunit [Candidatus Tokpelaia sp.]KAA6404867.1 twin-arginine translocase TatA/TatE family subunit [Candidatus Tokpelaia sp.]
MGNLFSPTHLLVILLICLILFGRGKISEFMGDFAKGIKSFKKGLSEDEDQTQRPHNRLDDDHIRGQAQSEQAKSHRPADNEPR